MKIDKAIRTAPWPEPFTGNEKQHFQMTLMSIPVGGDIGLEVHPDVDQFLSIQDECAVVRMGRSQNALTYQQKVTSGFAVLVPAGTWHNIINTGNAPLKLYSIYAPPQHPFGTVHKTKADTEKAEQQ